MNTNQLKKFAKEARIKLISQIAIKLDFVLTQDTAELRGKSSELAQIRSKLTELGREQLIETVAYTWFNRLLALRFMDANGYNTPKVVTPLPGMSNPEILQNALAGNIDEDLKFDVKRLNDLIDGRTSSSDAQTEAFKLLLVASCNKWHSVMPFMFERISDYTELLLPDDLLSDFSIVSDIRNGMSDEDCQQEELIGWLYQFYISDKKDDVFEALKKNVKISAENIPAATQIFTPRWVVRYMVENTLGKLWLTFKPNSDLKKHMPYLVESPIDGEATNLPEGITGVTDIKFIDPCQGSGHVLVYAFELFTKIYEEEGYNVNEIPKLILSNNIFGLDIDNRAAVLASFALSMKGRRYYSRFLKNKVELNVSSLVNIDKTTIESAIKLPSIINGVLITNIEEIDLKYFAIAQNVGSLLKVSTSELQSILKQTGEIWSSANEILLKQATLLNSKYHCVVTNSPYLGSKGMNDEMRKYVEIFYSKGKLDLMTCFMERCLDFSFDNGKIAMINLPSWLFLSSFEDIRKYILSHYHFDSLLHMGRGIFGIDFGSVAFVINKNKSKSLGSYFRLHQRNFQHIYYSDIEKLFIYSNQDKNYKYNFLEYRDEDSVNKVTSESNNSGNQIFYTKNQNEFEKIPGSPIGYWLDQKLIDAFSKYQSFDKIAPIRAGLQTGENQIFLREWHEVDFNNLGLDLDKEAAAVSNKRWFPYNKGGAFRKWFGNRNIVVNWFNDGEDIKNDKLHKLSIGKCLPSNSKPKNMEFYFRESITWSFVSSTTFGVRYSPQGSVFDIGGSSVFPSKHEILYLTALLNSKLVFEFLKILAPTINFQVGDIKSIPIKIDNNQINVVNKIAKECIEISKIDYDSREDSWDFTKSPLLDYNKLTLANAVLEYSNTIKSRFDRLLLLELELNKIINDSYEIDNDLISSIKNEEITIGQSEIIFEDEKLTINTIELLNQFISYSVGVIFGRYSLQRPGLCFSKSTKNIDELISNSTSLAFASDEDNIVPVLEDEWFNDDIVGRFKLFLKVTFGTIQNDENLRYIEQVIDKDIRKYFLKDFYNDHIKRYKKRPIYWMFSSPKGHFKALIYMHRYQSDLCSKMLNDYLQPFISKLEAAKQTNTLLALREDVTAREKTMALKEVDRLELMIRDCKDYERTLFAVATQKIIIDLDDGVKVNYLKLKDVLVPIKGLEKEED
jgi:hypothetical protein